MRLEYLRPGAAMIWTTPGAVRGRRIRIVVEELPGGGWDWTVWEAGRAGTSQFGVRSTAAGALGDAVAAAASLGLTVSTNSGRRTDDPAPVHGPDRGPDPAPDRAIAFATVETTAIGTRLIVGGVCVQWWVIAGHEPEAQRMAAEINAVFLTSHQSATEL